MKFVDVTNDVAFRKIFGNEQKKNALRSFLNAVIELPNGKEIVEVEITNPYQLGKLSGVKSTIVDVKAKDKAGNVFIVEMQVTEFDDFHKRILYYTSQSYATQIKRGSKYKHLQPVYFIGILDFTISQNPNYYCRHQVLDVETKERIVQDVEFNFIELPKFTKAIHELQTPIDQWTYFIKNAENLEVIPEHVTDEGLKEAYTEAEQQNWTEQELDEYEKVIMKEQEIMARKEFVDRKLNEAEAKGKEDRSIEIATKSIQRSLDNQTIMDITGLSIEHIEALRKKLSK